jgi:hypothetical protein
VLVGFCYRCVFHLDFEILLAWEMKYLVVVDPREVGLGVRVVPSWVG